MSRTNAERKPIQRQSAVSRSPSQLSRFLVSRLFGRYDHSIDFPHTAEASDMPSVVILHGPNGVGKTTVLRMLDGMMQLDFDMFRVTPFGTAMLQFTDKHELTVRRVTPEGPLHITFGGDEVHLHPVNKGAYERHDEPKVERFREGFFSAIQPISFELIETGRALQRTQDRRAADLEWARLADATSRATTPEERLRLDTRHSRRERDVSLSDRVRRFIPEAQVDAARFFTRQDPGLFERIFGALQNDELPEYSPAELIKTLQRIRREDKLSARFGLGSDRWDYGRLTGYLKSIGASDRDRQSLLVLGAYVESMEARADLRKLVIDRLVTFERIMAEFFADKSVVVGENDGLRIEDFDGSRISESQLSSGEFHLLYLMVSALVAKRRGTVIAIDEPEMSMHIAWQRKLISNLIKCASNAVPQFIFATHSPDVVAEWREFMVRFGPVDEQ